jgi:predicted Zn-dependent peptidase
LAVVTPVARCLLHHDTMLFGLVVLALLTGLTVDASASEYDPTRLYEVEHLKLENGFDVLLKKRTHASNVAIRLVVNVGLRNFPCDKRETPHFLEHLLFMGTSKHTEAELAKQIQYNGGYRNGITSATETVYQIDIIDKHLLLAIDTLYEIMTDAIITPQKIESVRAVIHRERSGNHPRLFRWLYEKGIGKAAATKAMELLLPGTGVLCPGLVTPDGISEADVREAYKNSYVPANMTLVVVGNFDRGLLLSQIKSTFGQLKPIPSNGSKVVTPPQPHITKEVTGTLSPLVGSDGTVGFAFRADTSGSPDAHAMSVLWKYLGSRLYESLRIQNALSYSPASAYFGERDYAVYIVAADANIEKMKIAKALLEKELEKLRTERVKAEDIEVAEQANSLVFAQIFESNSDIAHYYVHRSYELKTNGELTARKTAQTKLTPDDIQRVANKYLRDDSGVVIWSTPTFTMTQFFIALGLSMVAGAGGGIYLFRRFIRRCRNQISNT